MTGGDRRILPALAHKIKNLLYKSHIPCIEVRPSLVAGSGVFAVRDVEKDEVVALYPGIYTPPHPNVGSLFTSSVLPGEDDFSEMYLANIISPTGKAMEDCAYILNLQDVGGYVDGEALDRCTNDDLESLNANPSASGHLINHAVVRSNVEFECFMWNDIFDAASKSEGEGVYRLPNERRHDETPWYHDGEQIIRFSYLNNAEVSFQQIGGAAFLATTKIQKGEELFLNYRLLSPYPKWAQEWYSDCD